MSTIAQTPSGDLALGFGLRLSLVRRVADSTAIKLRNRMMFFQGEWFLDTRLGVPYRKFVFLKNPQIPLVKQMFRKVIEGTPGIAELLRLDLTSNKRVLRVDFAARTEDGFVISGSGLDSPFIVEVT